MLESKRVPSRSVHCRLHDRDRTDGAMALLRSRRVIREWLREDPTNTSITGDNLLSVLAEKEKRGQHIHRWLHCEQHIDNHAGTNVEGEIDAKSTNILMQFNTL